MTRILTILTMILLLTGCYNAPDKAKPMSWLFKQMPKDAPNAYKVGWKDGCESGLSSMSNTMYKTFYSFKQDKELRKNPVYYRTWKDTYTFCRHYMYGTVRQGNQRMNLPNQASDFQTTFMGASGIFESGLLNLHGPMSMFSNFGDVGGTGGAPLGMGGVMDFSGDAAINGANGAVGLNMDFSSGVPFFGATTVDRPMYVPKQYVPQ